MRLRRATNLRVDVSLAKLRQTPRVFSSLRVHQDGNRAKLQSQRGTPGRGRRVRNRGTSGRVGRRREVARRVRRVGERRARIRGGARLGLDRARRRANVDRVEVARGGFGEEVRFVGVAFLAGRVVVLLRRGFGGENVGAETALSLLLRSLDHLGFHLRRPRGGDVRDRVGVVLAARFGRLVLLLARRGFGFGFGFGGVFESTRFAHRRHRAI